MSSLNLKIVVAGSGGVGKTTLLRRYQSGMFVPASTTIGVNFVTQEISYENRLIILSIWDYAGEERFKALFPGYCSGSTAGFAAFDLTRPETLTDLSDWISIIFEKNGESIPIILVGTKLDAVQADRLVLMKDRAIQFAKDHNLAGFYTVSSKSGEGVSELFDSLANKIVEKLTQKIPL